MIETGKRFQSPGGSVLYEVHGPVCVLYDREELPWPSCSLLWKGKQPSWNRQGKRFVPDLAASRCHSYWVTAEDAVGNQWQQVLTLYTHRLSPREKRWWYWKGPSHQSPPDYIQL
jgi:hypothetical protein